LIPFRRSVPNFLGGSHGEENTLATALGLGYRASKVKGHIHTPSWRGSLPWLLLFRFPPYRQPIDFIEKLDVALRSD